MAKMQNLEKVLARLKKLPQAQTDAAAKQLAIEVPELVAAMKRAAPVDPAPPVISPNLRDSIHAYPNPNRPLSYRILADAKDKNGEFIGSHVEAGHRAKDGTHVPARPFFFPTYRARKKGMRRRMLTAARKALYETFPKG